MIWGKFPEHCDRELTAINFANAARSLELLGADGEDDDEDDDRDPVIALQGYEKVARALLSGGDKAAAVGRNHEILKHVNLKTDVEVDGTHGARDARFRRTQICVFRRRGGELRGGVSRVSSH